MNLLVKYNKRDLDARECGGQTSGATHRSHLSSDWDQPSHSFAVKLATTLSSTAVNEFQFSRAGNELRLRRTKLGWRSMRRSPRSFPLCFRKRRALAWQPNWGAGGYNIFGTSALANHEDLFIWKDDFSKVSGPHDLKFGALVSHNIKKRTVQQCQRSGIVLLDGQRTRAMRSPSCYSKTYRSDAIPSSTTNENALGRWHDFEVYGNDTFKVASASLRLLWDALVQILAGLLK